MSEVFKPAETQPVLQEAEKPFPGAVPEAEASVAEGEKAQAVAAANMQKIAEYTPNINEAPRPTFATQDSQNKKNRTLRYLNQQLEKNKSSVDFVENLSRADGALPPTVESMRSSESAFLPHSDTQTISQNSGSGNRDFSVQNDLPQESRLRKKPRYFEVSEEVRQREAVYNERNGAEAIRRVLDPHSGVDIVHAAMHDSRLGEGRSGDIDVVWGEAGDPRQGYSNGYGLAHIVAKHGMNILPRIANIIANGDLEVRKSKKDGHITRAYYQNSDEKVVLRHYNDARTEFFVITAYEDTKQKKTTGHSDGIQARVGQLAEKPSSLHDRSSKQSLSQNSNNDNRDFSVSPGRENELVQSAREVRERNMERGEFGPIWRGYEGEAAVEKLLKEKSGEIPGAVSTAELGPVDFMYGEIGSPGKKYTDGWGISHIAHKHGIDAAKRVPQILRGGVFLPQPNGRVYYESPEGRVVVKLEWKNKAKTWVLTSFLPENEKDSRFGSRIGIAEHAGESSSSPDGNLSNARISQSSNESNRDFSARSGLGNSAVRSPWSKSSWDNARPSAETRSGVESSGGYNMVSDGKGLPRGTVTAEPGNKSSSTLIRMKDIYDKLRAIALVRKGGNAPAAVLGYYTPNTGVAREVNLDFSCGECACLEYLEGLFNGWRFCIGLIRLKSVKCICLSRHHLSLRS